jgi:uncharacterized delta-60 repeat protein
MLTSFNRIPTQWRCVVLLLSIWICSTGHAQRVGDGYLADLTPPPGSISTQVNQVQILPDATVLIAGSFDAINGQPRRNIARLLPDGRVDLSFGNEIGPNDRVDEFVVLPDGKIVIIGTFSRVDDQFGFSRIARLNADGSLDASFNAPSLGALLAIARQSDGRLLVAGNSFPRVQRLNPDGSLDAFFVQPNVSAEDARYLVDSIAIDSSDRILLGGSFRTVAGVSRNLIARLLPDGSLDTSFESPFATPRGVSRQVTSILPDIDGRIYLGGGFFDIDDGQSTIRELVVRLLEDGRLDTEYVSNAEDPFASPVLTMALQPDGQLLIGGAFGPSATGLNRLGRLDLNGQVDPSLQPPAGNFGEVRAIDVQADGQILFGARQLLRLNTTGELDVDFDPDSGPDAVPATLSWQTPADYLIGGNFTQYNNTVQERIARIGPAGALDTTFATGDGPNGVIDHVTVGLDREVLVAGAFTEFDGQPRDALASLAADGNLRAALIPDFGMTGVVKDAIALQSGRFLVVGSFTEVDGVSRNRIARLNADGSLDNSFDPGLGANGTIHAVEILSNDRLWIGGEFTEFDGVPRERLARLTSTGWLDSPVINVDGPIRAMALQSDNQLLIGGDFQNVDSTPRRGLARVALSGDSFDAQLDAMSGQPIVNSIQIQADGKILIGGTFTSVQGQPVNRMARLSADGSLDPDFDTGFGAVFANGDPAEVTDLALLPNGKMLVSGDFDTLGGMPRSRMGRVLLPDAVEQSLNLADGVIRWTPGGSLPVASSVRFTASSDGINFSPAAINSRPERVDGVWLQENAAVDSGIAWIRVTPKFDPHGEVSFTQRILADAQINILVGDSYDFGVVKTGRQRQVGFGTQNDGDARLEIYGFPGLEAPFSSNVRSCGPLPITINPATSCLLGFEFNPTAVGFFSQTFEIMSNSADAPVLFTLTGTAVDPELTVTPTSIDFGDQAVGSATSSRAVVLSNTSVVDLELFDVSALTAPFVVSENNCEPLPRMLAPGERCELDIIFQPDSPGAITQDLSITSDAPGPPFTVTLSGTGLAAEIALNPTAISFAEQPLGTTGDPATVTVTSTGMLDLLIEEISIAGMAATDFIVGATSDTCTGNVVPIGDSCTFTLQFTPSNRGRRQAVAKIISNAIGGDDRVDLEGTGLDLDLLFFDGFERP